MKLAIISHTSHYIKDGETVGWGPTIREINHLADLFEEVYHIAPLYEKKAPASSLKYTNPKIKFIPLKPYGGEGMKDKISILTTAPHNIKQIKRIVRKLGKTDWIQFRSPTAMGLYVLPFLSINRRPKLWIKYAGNWKMENPPLSYSFQKWWLENNIQRSKVTINGYWKGQKEHIINFRNPCLETEELIRANESGTEKKFEGKLTICFSGALTENKGAGLLLGALQSLKRKNEIEEIIFAGDGAKKNDYMNLAKGIDLNITFKGFISRYELEKIYAKSHLIILPSISEGFPKVIAEAAAYGCVPIVSDVSSISQYFNSQNGFLLEKITSDEIEMRINEALNDRLNLKRKSLECIKISSLFTYENYIDSLKEQILSD